MAAVAATAAAAVATAVAEATAAVVAAAAVAATAAEVAEVAEAASEVVGSASEVVELASDTDTATEPAACRGELAASAKPDRFPIALIQIGLAVFDKLDPANPNLRGRAYAVQPSGSSSEECQFASWTREIRWSENMPCAGKAECWARSTC